MADYDNKNWYISTSEEGLRAPYAYRGYVAQKIDGGWLNVWRDGGTHLTRHEARKAALAKQRELSAVKAA